MTEPDGAARRGGAKRMVAGLLLFLVVAPLVFVAGIALAWRASHVSLDDYPQLMPGQTIQRQAGDRVTLLLDESAARPGDAPSTSTPATRHTGSGDGAAPCTVTGPDGRTVPLQRSSDRTYASHDRSWVAAYRFTAPSRGGYAVTCQRSQVTAMDTDDVRKLGIDIGWPYAIAFGLPFGIGVAGAMLVIWGFVARRASRPLSPYDDEEFS